MSLPHALLTSLLEKPSSGLDLTRRFEKSIGYFWQASHQQIYRELARLEEAGWVQSKSDEGARGRKKVYKVLPAGKKELQRWVASGSEARPLRDELMVRLRAEAVVGPTGLEQDIQKHLQAHQMQLSVYRDIEKRDFASATGSRAYRLQRLLLLNGIEYERMYIQLAEQALHILGAEEP